MAYIVKKGDTLQGLYGPNWKAISGYTGDPTKLQTGQQLPDLPTQPGSSSVMPNVPTPQITDIQKQITEKQGLLQQAQKAGYTGSQPILQDMGTGQITPAPQDISTAIQNKLSEYGIGTGTQQTPADKQKAYLDFITGQRTSAETSLGIPGQEATAKTLQGQIDTTNKLLDDLEANINERVRGTLTTEPLRQRMLAYERQPLTRQLSELGRAYNPVASELATSKQKLSEMMGQSEKAFQYGQEQTPREKFAQSIAEKQALQAIEAKSPYQQSQIAENAAQTEKIKYDLAHPEIKTSITEVGGRKLLVSTQTGETIKDLGPITSTPGAINTLDELAKAGYSRRGSSDGGWNFYKNGEPITAEKIVEATGVALRTLLAGSTNPEDIKKMDTSVLDPFEEAIRRATQGIGK